MAELPFRLIYDNPQQGLDGATNMARDEAISLTVGRGEQLPTLRLYGWSPPAISLGQSQRLSSVNLERCGADGVDIVRRTTGGLAILHTDELTYSICLPKDHPLAEGDVMSSYKRIAQAIIYALTALGVKGAGAYPVAKEDKAKGPVCFEAPSDYEVVGEMQGCVKKLVGSAQQRRVDAVLQHGSLPLYGDIGRICAYLNGAPSPDEVRSHAGTLAEAVGYAVDWQMAAEVWAKTFADTLSISYSTSGLSSVEHVLSRELRESKYANDVWTQRR
jgi:lipoate-protein ligase A